MDKTLPVAALLVILTTSRASGLYAAKCKTFFTYDVTEWPAYADSHDDLDRFSRYEPNERRCMLVYTNKSNHVIALHEVFFDLSPMSGQCTWDFLTIYDSSGFTNQLGRYCEDKGPGIINSTGPSIFLYFETDSIYEFFGFRIDASSLAVNPPEGSLRKLSGGAIAGIVLSVILVTVVLSVAVTFFIIYKTKYSKSKSDRATDHTEPDEHVYEVPGRCNSIATVDGGEVPHHHTDNLRYIENPPTRDHGHCRDNSIREDSSSESVDLADDISIQDYRGYELPSYIATISNNNGPSRFIGKQTRKAMGDLEMQQRDPPFYLTMDDSGVVEGSSYDEYQIPTSPPMELEHMGNHNNDNNGVNV